MNSNFAIRPNLLTIRIRPGRHWFLSVRQLCNLTNQLAIRFISELHWVLRGPNTVIVEPLDWQLELDQGVT
jgi:hypothetical protein